MSICDQILLMAGLGTLNMICFNCIFNSVCPRQLKMPINYEEKILLSINFTGLYTNYVNNHTLWTLVYLGSILCSFTSFWTCYLSSPKFVQGIYKYNCEYVIMQPNILDTQIIVCHLSISSVVWRCDNSFEMPIGFINVHNSSIWSFAIKRTCMK